MRPWILVGNGHINTRINSRTVNGAYEFIIYDCPSCSPHVHPSPLMFIIYDCPSVRRIRPFDSYPDLRGEPPIDSDRRPSERTAGAERAPVPTGSHFDPRCGLCRRQPCGARLREAPASPEPEPPDFAKSRQGPKETGPGPGPLRTRKNKGRGDARTGWWGAGGHGPVTDLEDHGKIRTREAIENLQLIFGKESLTHFS